MFPWSFPMALQLWVIAALALSYVNGLPFSPKNRNKIGKFSATLIQMTCKQDRRSFVVGLSVSLGIIGSESSPVLAFDGGVGGLGKVKPKTGVVFRDTDTSPRLVTASGSGETVVNELVGPDGSIALVSFEAPWPLLQSSGQIEARDLQQPESAFIQVADLPKGSTSADALPLSFYQDIIFSSEGKFGELIFSSVQFLLPFYLMLSILLGAYGAPFDVKLKRMSDLSNEQVNVICASFTTLTPGLRESPRKVYVSSKAVGSSVFMLVTGTTANRFKAQETVLTSVAQSFRAVEAPKSNLRSAQRD